MNNFDDSLKVLTEAVDLMYKDFLEKGYSRTEAMQFVNIIIHSSGASQSIDLEKAKEKVDVDDYIKNDIDSGEKLAEKQSFKPRPAKFEELVGKTLIMVHVVQDELGEDDEIMFTCLDGSVYRMYHVQDCCESVTIEDICGDLVKLCNSPITLAEEAIHEGGDVDGDVDSCTWTFYKLATTNEFVTIRWYGESNGYYSESVDFEQIKG